jgi:hypothetical protein
MEPIEQMIRRIVIDALEEADTEEADRVAEQIESGELALVVTADQPEAQRSGAAPVGDRPRIGEDLAVEVASDEPAPRTRPQMESAWQTLTSMLDRSVQQHGEDGHFAQSALAEARRQLELEMSARFGQEHIERLRSEAGMQAVNRPPQTEEDQA